MVVDEATLQSMASLDEALWLRSEMLEASRVTTAEEAISLLRLEMEKVSSRLRFNQRWF